MADAPIDIERLLRHRPFVRALARSLVRDDARAADLEQETWMVALRQPPRHAGALRAWLATVVKKLAFTQRRSEARRARREELRERPPAPVSPPEASEALEETLERARWHQRLVDAVMELPEPYRTTVLLSYFEEMDSSQIGALQGVPAATVRTRLRRAIERLRTKLDGTIEGGRGAWKAGLLVLAFPAGEAWATAASGSMAARLITKGPWAKGPLAAAGLLVAVVATGGALLLRESASSAQRAKTPHAAAAEGRSAGEVGEPHALPAPVEATEADEGKTLEVTVLAGAHPIAHAWVGVARQRPHPWRLAPHEPWLLAETGRTGADGRIRFHAPEDAYVRVIAMADGRARVEAIAYFPQEVPRPIVLSLPEEAPLEVFLADAATGEPIPGGRITVCEPDGSERIQRGSAPLTGRDGQTTIRGLSAGEVASLAATAEGWSPSAPRPYEREGGVRILLSPLDATRRWSVASGAPADASPLTLRRIDAEGGEGVARMEMGSLVAHALPRGGLPELLAIASDGSFARLLPESQEALHFAPPPLLEIRVVDTAGAPIADCEVALHDRATLTPLRPRARTNAKGECILPVYAADPVAVRVREEEEGRYRTVREFDPAGGSGRMEVALPVGGEVEVRVRLDGREQLPALYELLADGVRVRPRANGPGRSDRAGTLRFALRPERDGEEVLLHLLARGYQAAEARVVPGATPLSVVSFDLEPATLLNVQVFLREERQPFHLELVRLDAAGQEEHPLRGPWRFRLHPGPDHVVRDAMVPPGRYRVRDATSGRATEQFDVRKGDRRVALSLDLQETPPALLLLHGSVLAYRDLDLAQVELRTSEGARIEVQRDGAFTFAFTHATELIARHPHVAEEARLLVQSGAAPVTLELTPVTFCAFRCVPPPRPLRAGETEPRVLLLRDGLELPLLVTAREDGYRIGGYRPGPADLWIDLPGFAPRLLSGLLLRGADEEVASVALSRGSSLRVRLLLPGGLLPPEVVVSAQAESSPRYQRSLRTSGEAEASLPGLGAGSFRVTVWERFTGQRLFSGRIDADGEHDLALEIDLGS